MVGEVWLCSGQSNMEMGIGACRDAQQEIAAANYPGIRLLMVPKSWTPEPQNDIGGSLEGLLARRRVAEGGWGGFSAAAIISGASCTSKLGVAVGLIDSTWGGTRIEPWTPPEGFAAVPALKQEYERVQLGDPRTARASAAPRSRRCKETEQWLAAARQALTERKRSSRPCRLIPPELLPPHDVQHATALYNGMIHPLCPFALRGAIWYQGESNSGEGMLYAERMKALIGGWRQVWGEGDFPFYFVQIAPLQLRRQPGDRSASSGKRRPRRQAIPNTGMAVINDIGDLKDIHPTNKQEVGRRLALWALAKTYGQNEGGLFRPDLQSDEPSRATSCA